MATSQTAFGLCQVCDRLHSERIGAIVDHSTEEVRCPDASQSTFKPIVPGPHCSVPTLPTASAPACAHGRLAAQLGSAADERRAILRCSCHVLRHAVTCCRMLPHVAGCRHMLRVLLQLEVPSAWARNAAQKRRLLERVGEYRVAPYVFTRALCARMRMPHYPAQATHSSMSHVAMHAKALPHPFAHAARHVGTERTTHTPLLYSMHAHVLPLLSQRCSQQPLPPLFH
jgi:hypothetical protein